MTFGGWNPGALFAAMVFSVNLLPYLDLNKICKLNMTTAYITLQRRLSFRLSKLLFSVGKISPVILMLNENYQIESGRNIISLQRQDDFQQNPKLRQSNTWCFFSPI